MLQIDLGQLFIQNTRLGAGGFLDVPLAFSHRSGHFAGRTDASSRRYFQRICIAAFLIALLTVAKALSFRVGVVHVNIPSPCVLCSSCIRIWIWHVLCADE